VGAAATEHAGVERTVAGRLIERVAGAGLRPKRNLTPCGRVSLAVSDITRFTKCSIWARGVSDAVDGAGLDLLIINARAIAAGPLETVPIEVAQHALDESVLGTMSAIKRIRAGPSPVTRPDRPVPRLVSVRGAFGFVQHGLWGIQLPDGGEAADRIPLFEDPHEVRLHERSELQSSQCNSAICPSVADAVASHSVITCRVPRSATQLGDCRY
jgi:hypothetical protein